MKPVPAATVAILRPSSESDDLEVLLVKRNSRLVFHGGHWVFPGGRLDNADFLTNGSEYLAAQRAAVRETREESGLELDPERLIHTAHWTTPPNLPRRFSTWFFVYPLTGLASVRVDNDEILAYRWLTPRAALAQADAGEFVLPRPTTATLGDLAGFRDLRSMQATLQQSEIRVFPENSPYYRPREMGL